MYIFPLSYSIPIEYFNNNTIKNNIIAPLIPGDLKTYIYDKEEDYYKMYRESKFAFTKKKYGWDCLRHYEILSSNCIPLFDNLKNCPVNTMINIPKKLIIESNYKFNNKTITQEEINEYSKKIFKYSIENLSCKSRAKYFLDKIISISKINKDISELKILMLTGTSGYRNVNYSRELLSIGLRRILGDNFIDYPKLKVLYKGCKRHKCIGKGFSYTGLLEDTKINRDKIKERIIDKYFDFIIYGKVGNKNGSIQEITQLRFWNHVFDNYPKEKISFVYGGDLSRNFNDEDLLLHSKYGICFVRELK